MRMSLKCQPCVSDQSFTDDLGDLHERKVGKESAKSFIMSN